MQRPLRIVYDGDCPFCSRYVALLRLRERFDVELVDARAQPDLAASYGLDLDEGMIADVDGTVWHGSDAVWILSRLTDRSGTFNRAMGAIFSWRPAATVLYPVMRLGRRAALLALRRKPIGSDRPR